MPWSTYLGVSYSFCFLYNLSSVLNQNSSCSSEVRCPNDGLLSDLPLKIVQLDTFLQLFWPLPGAMTLCIHVAMILCDLGARAICHWPAIHIHQGFPNYGSLDLDHSHLAPVLWWAEYRPLLPDTELPESNSDLRTPKSTVVSATLRRSYSVPDLLVLYVDIDFELADLPDIEPGALGRNICHNEILSEPYFKTLTITSHLWGSKIFS